MIISDVVQGSEEWFKLKTGMPSASSFDKILTIKGEPSKSATKYMYQLAGERVTGVREEGYTNAAMQKGVEREAEAVQFYELVKGITIQRVGICYKDESKKFLCSPDGLVGEDGLVEFKCPLLSTHVDYLINGKLLTDYFQQVQGQLMVTGRKWCDLVSYFPGIKPLIVHVERDEKFIETLEKTLKTFCSDLEKTYEKIKD